MAYYRKMILRSDLTTKMTDDLTVCSIECNDDTNVYTVFMEYDGKPMLSFKFDPDLTPLDQMKAFHDSSVTTGTPLRFYLPNAKSPTGVLEHIDDYDGYTRSYLMRVRSKGKGLQGITISEGTCERLLETIIHYKSKRNGRLVKRDDKHHVMVDKEVLMTFTRVWMDPKSPDIRLYDGDQEIAAVIHMSPKPRILFHDGTVIISDDLHTNLMSNLLGIGE